MTAPDLSAYFWLLVLVFGFLSIGALFTEGKR